MKTVMTSYFTTKTNSKKQNLKNYIIKNFVYSNIYTNPSDEINYSNFLFNFNTSQNKNLLIFKTKYLTPSLYIRHLLLKPIEKDNNGYYTIIFDKNNKENKNSIPSIYLLMLYKFSKQDIYVLTEDDDTDFKNRIDKMEIEENELDKIYNYKQNINVTLKIEDKIEKNMYTTLKKNKNWMTMDGAYGSNSLSPYTHSIFSKIYYDENIKLHTVCRYEGGIVLDDIYNKMNIYNPRDTIINQNFIRCMNDKYNIYSSFESDIETITYFQELLKKYGIQSVLE